MTVRVRRHRKLRSARTSSHACRLHAVLCILVPGEISRMSYPAPAVSMIDELELELDRTVAPHSGISASPRYNVLVAPFQNQNPTAKVPAPQASRPAPQEMT